MLIPFYLPLGYWVHNLNPFIIKFPEGFLVEGIRWYGVSYVVSFLLTYLAISIYRHKGKIMLSSEGQIDLITGLILGVLLGGRLGYMLFYNLKDFLSNPLIFFQLTQGGMASHGGIIGAVVALVWFSKKHKVSFLAYCDVIATIAPLGIFLGRIANFINGELWGKVSTVSWAVIFPNSAPWLPVYMVAPRHPSQLYEALLEGLLLFIYTQARFWQGKLKKGQLAGEFLVGYAILRFIVEFFREPDAALILGLQRGQFYSILLFLAGILFILCSFLPKKSTHNLSKGQRG